MLKLFTKYLLLLFVCVSATAQQPYLYRYVTGSRISYSPANFYTDQKFYDARHLPDSLNVQIRTADEAQLLINAGLHLRTYGVEVHADSLHIAGVLEQLKKFPQLRYLKFNEAAIFARNIKPFKLPDNIKDLQQVAGVEFSFTAIERSDALQKLTALKNLSALALTNVGTDVAINNGVLALKNIHIIKISGRNIKDMDLDGVKWEMVEYMGDAPNKGTDEIALQKLSGVKALRDLTLSYCQLGDDISVLSKFTQLRTLSIWGTQFKASTQLFGQLSYLHDLRSLTVRFYKDSTQTLSGIDQLKGLEQLNLDGFNITTIPSAITGLNHLKTLTLQGSPLNEVPAAILTMPDLEVLDLSSNKITSLPNTNIGSRSKLKRLSLSYNAIGELPAWILSLSQLETLEAASNQIKTIPVTGWQALPHLKEVKLSMNRINTFPDGLQQVPSLETLELSYNDISTMADLTADHYRMRLLDLSGNNFSALPEHFGKYTELEDLNIRGNRLAALPASLGDCIKLKKLNAGSDPRVMVYHADRPMTNRYDMVTRDSTKKNHIQALPAGLKNAKNLEELRLEDNLGINSESVFEVILAMPRKYLQVQLYGDGITALPATDKWLNAEFDRLDLSSNKITALPVQFAYMKRFNNVYLNRNPLPVDPAIIAQEINTRADMKIMYDALNITLPDYPIDKSAYAMALAKQVSNYFNKNQWAKAVTYADKATAADPAAYGKKVAWEEIGICRFETKDYQGAIRDFERFMAREDTTFIHWGASLTSAEDYKARAHLALGQKEKAAQTHEYFAKKHNSLSGFQEAAIIYKSVGNEKKYRQMMDTALLFHQERLEGYNKQKYKDISFILDYAEVLIIAGRPVDAAALLNDQDAKLYIKQYLPIKNYLLATANYLNTPAMYPQLKKELSANTGTTGKVTGWSFDMFNDWVSMTVKDQTQKDNLMALETIVK